MCTQEFKFLTCSKFHITYGIVKFRLINYTEDTKTVR